MMIAAAPLPHPAVAAESRAGDYAFAADLYKAAEPPTGNLFLSPASVRIALAMTAAGALGDTAAEMQSVLHLDKNGEANNALFSALLQDWGSRAKPALPKQAPAWQVEEAKQRTIEFHVVDRLWAQAGDSFRPAFLATLAKSYRAPLEQLDFAHALDAAVARINAWIAEQTAGKIQNLIAPQALSTETKLVLTNAIYFKAQWSNQFSRSMTAPSEFFNGTNRVSVPTMNQTASFPYGETDDARVLEMPYADGSMSMVIVLPKEQNGLPALEKSLSGTSFEHWLAALGLERVHLQLPKLKIESTFSLAPALASLGMKTAFSMNANFKGMSDEPLYIGSVVHKAFIDLDEEGTEAAAATAVAMLRGGPMREPPPPKEMKVDHPFFFFIRDTKSGTILFAGRITDPAR